MPFKLELRRVISRARELHQTGPEVTISLPGARIPAQCSEADRAVLELFVRAASTSEVLPWLDKEADTAIDPSSVRRAISSLESAARLARMALVREPRSPSILLFSALTDAVMEFRSYERAAGILGSSRFYADAPAPEHLLALETLRQHAARVFHRITLLNGNHRMALPITLDDSDWDPAAYKVLSDEFFRLFRYIVAQREYYASFPSYNYTRRERPTDESAAGMLSILRRDWSQIVGLDLATVTHPLQLTGAKLRRLVVEADFNASPPWGTWQALSNGPERKTFTDLRAAINAVLVPHAVDHIDFVRRPEAAE